MEDDYDYFTESISESLILMFWTSFATVSLVGIIMFLAMR